ncbi:MAG TPA: aldo/keto reductase [Gemmatimonadaceae bacterium]|jgi:aryl-alcohol dehydrogenase-like predicted oxidoreductase
MNRPPEVDVFIEGRASDIGTKRFAKRFAKAQPSRFFRALASGPQVSALGFGTYLGECDDAEDARYINTIALAIERGVNVIDTAINYRCQRSERAIGEALRLAVEKKSVQRDEVVVCTKGGYIPLERTPPNTKEGYRGFLQSEYYGPGIMSPDDVVAGGHCMTPRYLADQIERSRRNLGISCIDVYYLHNPEQQLDTLDRNAFSMALHSAFSELEEQVSRGAIASYGCATWHGFRSVPTARNHLDLEELCAVARAVGGDSHHFRVVQLPVNLAMAEAVRAPTQKMGKHSVPLLEAAHEMGISVIGSATLMQSQLASSLPEQIKTAFPGYSSDARRAVAFAQSLPITAALVGMKSVAHLDQNLERGLVS